MYPVRKVVPVLILLLIGISVTKNAFGQIHFLTYQNPFFAIKYPSYMLVGPEHITANYTVVPFHSAGIGVGVAVVKLPQEEYSLPKDLMASVHLAHYLAGLVSTIHGSYNRIGSVITNIAGNPANKTDFILAFNGHQAKGMALSSIMGNNGVIFSYVSDIDSYPVFLPTAQKMINSFSLMGR